MRFRDVVPDPALLMGFKPVWRFIEEPMICFDTPGTAAKVANEARESPFVLAIGAGKKCEPEARGRLTDLLFLTPKHGETAALAPRLVADPARREWLSRWKGTVVAQARYRISGAPSLKEDLDFPDARFLRNAYSRIVSPATELRRAWQVLGETRLEPCSDPLLPEEWQIPPGPPQLQAVLEGQRRLRTVEIIERNSSLARRAKLANRTKHGGVLVCEACRFHDADEAMFDAHHLSPLATGPSHNTVASFAVLCPTCHRIAHAKAEDPAKPLMPTAIRAMLATAPATPSAAPAPAPSAPPARNS